MNQTEQVLVVLKYNAQCSEMARSGRSAPGGACMWVLSLRACIPASDKATCRNHPAEISFRSTRELGVVHEHRLLNLCR